MNILQTDPTSMGFEPEFVVLDWWKKAQEGDDEDDGSSYPYGDDDFVYPRGGVLGTNRDDDDDGFWQSHRDGNDNPTTGS